MGKKKNVSRREFLHSAVALGATGTILGMSAPFRSAKAATVETEYDYIVVGTGAGGAPLAARLALKGYSVLCLEAGFKHVDKKGESPDLMKTPVFHASSTEVDEWSWNFYVRHNGKKQNVLGQSHADLNDSKFEPDRGGILYPRASGIGGCTTHNAMITMYPDNKDWSDIEKLSGDSSWSPERMRDYFEKIENKKYGWGFDLKGAHGHRGWLSTTQTSLSFLLENLPDNHFLKLVLANLKAWGKIRDDNTDLKQLLQIVTDAYNGFRKGLINLDTNSITQGPKPEGVYRTVSAITEDGKRSGPKDWLLQVAQRKDTKLDIKTGHLTTKVLFGDDSVQGKRVAKAVECLVSRETNLYKASPNHEKLTVHHEVKTYKAKKEIILAGGAFNTPQLLMLSGVGDENELRSHNIKPQISLPAVGKNLQDRYELGVVSDLNEEYEALKDCTFNPADDPCLDDYKNDPENSLYSTNGVVIGNLYRSRYSKNKTGEDPDLFIFAVPGNFRGYYTGWSKESFNPQKLTWAILKAKTSNTNGTVKLKSKNPTDTPEINFNHFTDNEEDLLSMVDGVDFVRKINSKSPLRELVREEQVPGRDVNREEDLKKYVAKEAWGHHASCTCPMGQDVRTSVTDFDFKVHNTTNLRIVDASVFPKIPGHFIVTPIYMIAEKAADVIERDWS